MAASSATYGTLNSPLNAPAQRSMLAPLAVRDADDFKLYDHNSVKLAGAPWETLNCSQRFVRAIKAFFCGICCIACCSIECCCGAIIWLKMSIWASRGQNGSCHMILCDLIRGSPGKHLEVKDVDDVNSDVIIPSDFVSPTSRQLKLHSPSSLRRSIQPSIDFEMEFGRYSGKIMRDDSEKPVYFLNGGVNPADSSLEYAVWTTPAKKTVSWGALTVVNDYVDTGCCCLRQHSTELPADGVLGYITVLQITNEMFLNQADAYYHITKAKHGELGMANATIEDPVEQRLAENKIL